MGNKRERGRGRGRQCAVTLSLLPLSDEKSVCYRAIINYVPPRMVEGARGLVCMCMCVSSRNRTPTQLVRQLGKETNSSPRYQDRPAAPVPATPDAAADAHAHTSARCTHIFPPQVPTGTYTLSDKQNQT